MKAHHSANGQRIPIAIVAITLAILGLGFGLFLHARGETNHIALASEPKGVMVVDARAATFRPERRYIGTIEPWIAARIGPQLVSAYIDTVLVRPGAVVKRGEVLATLDCRNASSMQKAISMQARALAANQAAVAKEAARISSLLQGGFASPNEVENKQAESASKQAQLLALQAQMLGSSLQVSDCVLRAPFDGEVADRDMDPGAFVRPGAAIATLVDRSTVRVTADVPENDFDAVAPGTEVSIHILSTNAKHTATIARRAPAADPETRTVHVEIDMANTDRSMPVGTTAELTLGVGLPADASMIPLAAATIKGKRATIFVVEHDTAHARAVPVQGELAGQLYVDRSSLSPGALVVTEGRTMLLDGDHVRVKNEAHVDGKPESASKSAHTEES